MLYVVRRWRLILAAIFVVCVLFIALHAIENPCGFALKSVSHSTQVALGFLMAMESPETSTSLAEYPSYMRVFAWFVCISGWLLLPLLVGAMLDVGFESIHSESKFRFIFRQVGISAKLSGPALNEFVEEMMKRKDEIIRG